MIELKVFQLDDFDWWVGYDLVSVLKEAREQCGDDAFPYAEDDAYELTGEDLDRLLFNNVSGDLITFRKALWKISPTFTAPLFFASTEE